MLKTIKTTKELRLDELIKYAWENDIRNKLYYTDNNQSVKFLGNGRYESGWNFGSDDLFEVVIEEEITEDTVFEHLIAVERDDNIFYECKKSVGFILSKTSDVIQILASVNGKYRTVWERDN